MHPAVDPIGYTITFSERYAVLMSKLIMPMGTYEIYSPRNPDGCLHCQVAVSLYTTSKLSESH